MHGYGANKALGGAGSANPQDAMAGATNPAGAVWVGDRVDVGGELFKPNRGYKISAPGKSTFDSNSSFNLTNAGDAFGAINQTYSIESSKNAMESDIGFLIPSMGIVKQLPHGNAIGFSIYGAGMGTEYDRDDTPDVIANINGEDVNFTKTQGINGTFMDGSTGVDLLLIMANLHFASKITDDISIGVGLVGAAQRFKAKGLGAFQMISQGKIKSGEGDWAFGLGFNTGIQWNINDQFSVAASYYSKIKLTHDKYTGLFADEGDFSLAPITNIGMTYKPNRTSALSFDVQWIQYSQIPAPGNKFEYLFRDPSEDNPLPIVPLGNKDGAGFGFEDSIVYKVGYQFKMASLPKYIWRVGYAYQDQIIPKNGTLFPMLAPATITEHFTAGMSHQFSENIDLNMNFLYSPKETVKGEGISEGVDIWLEEYALEFGLGYKY
ncbi:OmpP1/FadL family transporter [sulfur-oxidizing endosymbiont of Gigantopelta aegis]|uniref:OmpP1/FadL family transporter n=1 Tax=sulfur-oxidizing endosymbiont of Gigantopelta aegis TaxID=2794934 RepID=UPI0018DD6F3C|nr:outer membrane protein transport protein [sulfur-oxidizing endosymbiont of Gigantopelta aegis]